MAFQAPEYRTRVVDNDRHYSDARRQAEEENIERLARAIRELKGENGGSKITTPESDK